VQGRDGGLGVAIGAHLDEGEAARAPGLAVARNGDVLDDASVGREGRAQRVLGGAEVEVPDVELGSHGWIYLSAMNACGVAPFSITERKGRPHKTGERGAPGAADRGRSPRTGEPRARGPAGPAGRRPGGRRRTQDADPRTGRRRAREASS